MKLDLVFTLKNGQQYDDLLSKIEEVGLSDKISLHDRKFLKIVLINIYYADIEKLKEFIS